VTDVDLDEVVRVLREQGAVFAYLFGSRVDDTARPDSDWDVGAFFGRADVVPWKVDVPDRVDLVVLDDAPLHIAGRVAMYGRLLFEDDPAARVEWEATTRKIWLDERPRVEQATRDFVASFGRRGRR